MGKATRFAAFLPLILALAACELPNLTGPGSIAPGSTASGAGDESRATAPTPERAEPLQAPAVTDPAVLVGLDGDGITALMGQPGFSRYDGPARVLQYSSTFCVLDLFLYSNGSEATLRVTHVELRGLGASPTTTVACMRSLAKPIRKHDV